mmetsp:Transcript_21883/g.55710  ORF Transcript_21883/g.55710 Transcript_21883/m.55710 type:complete len:593 (-) Transcript_21883:343-2121(-)
MARGFGAKAKGAGAKQAEQKGNRKRGNAVAVRDVQLSESDDDEQHEQDAFKARRDKVSLNVEDDLDQDGFEDDEEAVMDLGDGSDDEGSEDDEDDDEDGDDEDDIIEAALARGGNTAKLARLAKDIGRKVKLAQGEDSDEDEEEDEEEEAGPSKAGKKKKGGDDEDGGALWGANKKAYYADESEEYEDDEEALREQQEEVERLEKARASKLKAADYELSEDEEEGEEEDDEDEESEEEEEEEDTGTRRGAQLYTLPYPLRDVSKFVNVAHVGGTQYLYTATMLRSTVGQGPTGDSGVAAAQPEAQEQEQEFGQEVGHMPEGQPVLVKYTAHDYGEAAHRALAAQGLAPALHSCTTLQGGLVEVVMDHLSQDGGWHSLASLPPASLAQAAPAVLQAVNRMHAIRITDVQSGVDGPISHGDLRPANIMVRQQQPSTGSWCDVEVRFVDFDWACVDGAGTYPAFLNPELNWPSGVAAGKPITRQHDSEFLGNHLSSIQSTSAALPGAPPRRRGRGRASPKQPPQAIMGGQSIASRRVPSQAAVPQPHYPVRCSAQLGVGGAQVLRLPHTSSCRGGPHMRPAAGNLRHAGKVYLPL